MIRRSIDIVISAAAILALLPVFAVVSIAIALESRGGVFFVHDRMGRGFRRFRLYKFRTMVPRADGPEITIAGDSRVTNVGAWLRKTKLDELPQLINVLKGDMTLVGPRPEVPGYVEMFHADYVEILKVKPGITDLASVTFSDEAVILARSGAPVDYYVKTVLPRKLRLSKEGIARSSFAFDLGLLVRTFGGILGDLADVVAVRRRRMRQSLKNSAWFHLALRVRRPFIITFHGLLAGAASFFAVWLRFDGAVPPEILAFWRSALPIIVVVRLAWCMPFRLFEGLWRYTSLWDLRNILLSTMFGSVSLYTFFHWMIGYRAYPRSAYIIESVLLMFMMGGVRLAYRIAMEFSRQRPGRRLLVYGAGDAGEFVVRELKAHSRAGVQVIGFIDDDRAKVGSRIHGVRVLGTRIDVPEIVRQFYPDEVIVAIADVTPASMRSIVAVFEPFNVPITSVRGAAVVGREPRRLHRTAISLEDLVVTGASERDVRSLQQLVTGTNVLVAGAGRLVGGEIARQLLDLNPAKLTLFDSDEDALHAITVELHLRAPRARVLAAVGQPFDRDDVSDVLRKAHPALVVDATGYEHAPLAEENPGAALSYSVGATRTLVEAAERFGVARFVYVSSASAAADASVLATARTISELLVRRQAAAAVKTAYTIARIGTVLSDRRGFLATLLDQIHHDGPVTLPHPEMRRVLMLLPDAASLVLCAAAQGTNGATYVPEVRESVPLVDVARNLIRLAGTASRGDLRIEFTGVPPGEKLDDDLVAAGESIAPEPGAGPLLRVDVPPATDRLARIAAQLDMTAGHSTGEHLTATLREFRSAGRRPSPADAALVTPSRLAMTRPPEGQPCPGCGGDVHRSRARNLRERLQKGLTDRRLYRCDHCGWRGWLVPLVVGGPIAAAPLAPADLQPIDVVLPVDTAAGASSPLLPPKSA